MNQAASLSESPVVVATWEPSSSSVVCSLWGLVNTRLIAEARSLSWGWSAPIGLRIFGRDVPVAGGAGLPVSAFVFMSTVSVVLSKSVVTESVSPFVSVVSGWVWSFVVGFIVTGGPPTPYG